MILLGGNQDDRIKFSPFNMSLVQTMKVTGKDGREKEVVVKNSDYLRYFVPAIYYEKARKDLESPGLDAMNVDALNKVIGVLPESKKRKTKTKTN